jgi:glycosyltransferase
VHNQAFTSYEHIFIDGYSQDNTIGIIKKYISESPEQVRMYQSKPKGISHAMNLGVKKSNGNYLIHLHSDDRLFDDDVLGDVMDFINNNHRLDWLYGKAQVVEEDGGVVGYFPDRKIFQLSSFWILKYFNFIPHQSVFIKREVFDRYGYFREDITSAMDVEMWMRLSTVTEWKFFNRIISKFMIRSGAQSSSKQKVRENHENLLTVKRKHLNKFEYMIYRAFKVLVDRINKTKR